MALGALFRAGTLDVASAIIAESSRVASHAED
jgi:hypothetical protein